MEELVQLPGVGRKTANCVCGGAFGIPGIVVDTHVKRLAYRMGLTTKTDPEDVEQDLMKIIPPKRWFDFSNMLIWHGRKTCIARKPLCEVCPVNTLCPRRGV
jgi:endonuclease-3